MEDEGNESATPDTLSLSFVDVLSCGLGACVILFLLFSVMPHAGAGSIPQRGAESVAARGQVSSHPKMPSPGSEEGNEAIGLAPLTVTVRILAPAAFELRRDPWELVSLPPGAVTAFGKQVALLQLTEARYLQTIDPEFAIDVPSEVSLLVEIVHAGDAAAEPIHISAGPSGRVGFSLGLPTAEAPKWVRVTHD